LRQVKKIMSECSPRVVRHNHKKTPPQLKKTQTSKKRYQEESEEENHWEVVQEEYIHAKLSGFYQDELFRTTTNISEPSEQQQQPKQSDFYNLSNNIQLVGLDTDEPILQIGKEVFAGKFEDSAETSVFFRCRQTTPRSTVDQIREDPVFSRDLPNVQSTFECKTSKILRFKRVFLTAKESSADPDQTSTVTDDNNDDADSVTNITAIAN
jgi:hypothetical protein